jgi:C_GCAxxG_C_C family probable redox protein
MKIACGLGAGMGRKEEVSGAVTGGILVLGMRHGKRIHDERTAMELTYKKTQELMNLFAIKHGVTFVDNSSMVAILQQKLDSVTLKIMISLTQFVKIVFKA